jgi:hypothetical protein
VLSFFRTNQLAFNVFLIFYVILLRGSSFITPDQSWVSGKSGVLSLWINDLLNGYTGLSFIIGILLVFIHAILINVMIARFRMANEVTLLPGLCYILLASSIPEFLYLSPILLANTFFIITLFELFGSYRQKSIVGNIFNVGFWLGVGSLFYFSEIIFLLFAFFSSSILRTFRMKESLITMIGFIVPYILASVYFFWNDAFVWFWEHQITSNLGFLDFNFTYNWETYSKLAFFAILFLIVFKSFGSYMFKKNLQVQKNITILYWALFFAFFSIFVQADIRLEHLHIFVIPLSIFLSFNLSSMRQPLAEAVHLLILVGIIVLQFKDFWM